MFIGYHRNVLTEPLLHNGHFSEDVFTALLSCKDHLFLFLYSGFQPSCHMKMTQVVKRGCTIVIAIPYAKGSLHRVSEAWWQFTTILTDHKSQTLLEQLSNCEFLKDCSM
jgi:hypothetical protein